MMKFKSEKIELEDLVEVDQEPTNEIAVEATPYVAVEAPAYVPAVGDKVRASGRVALFPYGGQLGSSIVREDVINHIKEGEEYPYQVGFRGWFKKVDLLEK